MSGMMFIHCTRVCGIIFRSVMGDEPLCSKMYQLKLEFAVMCVLIVVTWGLLAIPVIIYHTPVSVPIRQIALAMIIYMSMINVIHLVCET